MTHRPAGAGYADRMSILHPKVVPLLVGGFAMVILLMLATGKRGFDALAELERGTSGLLSEERQSARSVNNAQDLEIAFDQIYYSVPGATRPIATDELMSRLEELQALVDEAVVYGVQSANEPAEREQWAGFEAAARAFLDYSRASLAAPGDASLGRAVTDAHERLANAVGRLVRDSDRRAERLAVRDHAAFSAALQSHVLLTVLAGLLATVVAGLTVFLVVRLFRRIEWQRQELARLSSDMLKTQEATLRRVSHDLHDQFGQALTAVEANLTALDGQLQDRALRGRVEDCIGLIKDLMSEARSLSQLLRPSILDDFGLSASIEWLADRFRERTGIAVSYVSTVEQRLGDDTETHLFRIAQEAFTNVARHAGASKVEAGFHLRDNRVVLSVEDNGRGRQSKAGRAGGMGLAGMRARVEQIGGEMVIDAGPLGGTRVVVHAPIRAAEAA